MLCRRECLARWPRWGRWPRPAGRLGHHAVRAASTASTAPATPAGSERGEAYVHMKSTIPLLTETIGQVLQRTAAKYPERVAVASHYQNQKITFNDLLKKADRLAAGLLALGLSKGDRVAMWGPNSLEWVLVKLAVARAGLVLVTLNPAYQASELGHCLRKVRAKGLICNHTFKTQNYHKLMLEVAPEIATSTPGNIRSDSLPDFKALVTITNELLPGSLRLSEAIAAGTDKGVREVRERQGDVDPFDIVEIQFTSGTTGSPKAAMLTHHNVVNNAHFHNLRRYTTGSPKNHDLVCSLVPFFHVFASVIGILACVEAGDTLVIAAPHYEPGPVYEAIKAQKPTVMFGAPTMFVDLLQELERHGNQGFESIDMLFSGAAIATVDLLNKIKKVLPQAALRQGYGMTETSPATFTIPYEVDDPNRVLSYVGQLLPHLEAKVIDPNGKTVPFGERGELCIRGYATCKGYWDDLEKTRELIDEQGWLRTGDQFVLEEDGYARIVGRIKELIIRGGENIAPKEVESALSMHPAVLEATVYGVPDERMGEEIAAAIRLKDPAVTITLQEMKAFLKGKVAHYKVPKYLDVMPDFPKNPSGKIQKFKLQNAFIERMKK
ncbi:medium-chain acyl-CoA ligase ACSF2, mitochondrial-like [Thrips palmi]|uniref:Medium-chain acyl-CoA ligase ACSF2, mitochondrial n=1 Tax=Thrips palmi TaxID=161013 RepID=A0A6P8YVM9_THRPL|nr:medium-chain acyl-CoA ligase ACSF2, mitochondrial-like [Thrips palmi]XP_034241585.1 medium-chain acyl-CoA ligase ACSF2, mitochondrial-like [Thrips palmi]